MSERLNWEAIKNICQRVANREELYEKPKMVRWVAFDEIALKKRHRQYVLVKAMRRKRGEYWQYWNGEQKKSLSIG